MSNSWQPLRVQLARLLHPRDSPGKNIGMGGHFFLQGIFPTQGSNKSLLSSALAGGFFTTSTTWEAHPTGTQYIVSKYVEAN